jgi:hypothetical protein
MNLTNGSSSREHRPRSGRSRGLAAGGGTRCRQPHLRLPMLRKEI